MKFAIGTFVVMLSLLGTSRAYAQSAMAGPGTVEVALIPGGSTFSSLPGRTVQGYRAGVLRSGHPIRPPRLWRDRPEPGFLAAGTAS
jgi:hypothetical protein